LDLQDYLKRRLTFTMNTHHSVRAVCGCHFIACQGRFTARGIHNTEIQDLESLSSSSSSGNDATQDPRNGNTQFGAPNGPGDTGGGDDSLTEMHGSSDNDEGESGRYVSPDADGGVRLAQNLSAIEANERKPSVRARVPPTTRQRRFQPDSSNPPATTKEASKNMAKHDKDSIQPVTVMKEAAEVIAKNKNTPVPLGPRISGSPKGSPRKASPRLRDKYIAAWKGLREFVRVRPR
jgi:hypothetical protein